MSSSVSDGRAFAAYYLQEVADRFASTRQQAEKALAQVGDRGFFAQLDPETNSLAMIVKHMGGNLRSRWSDVFTTDGEKPDRDRDGEFRHEPGDTRASLMELWDRGWRTLEATLATLTPEDLLRPIRIRGEEMALADSLSRALAHAAHHVGQIVLLAKHDAGPAWKTLSIPRDQSREFAPPRKG